MLQQCSDSLLSTVPSYIQEPKCVTRTIFMMLVPGSSTAVTGMKSHTIIVFIMDYVNVYANN